MTHEPLKRIVCLLVPIVCATPRLDAATQDRWAGTWMEQGVPYPIRVAIDRSSDDYFVTLHFQLEESEEGAEKELVTYAFGFRCRMDGELLRRSEPLFALSWCDHRVDLEEAYDWKLQLDRSGGVIEMIEPFRTSLLRASDAAPSLGTWVVELTPDPRRRDQRELMVVRGDGEYRVVELRQFTTYRGQTEAEAKEGKSRELLSEVGCRIEYRANWRRRLLYLTPIVVVLENGERVDVHRGGSLVRALGLDGPAYLLFDGERALYVAPHVAEGGHASVDYGDRRASIHDGSFDGEWRASGTFSSAGDPWEYVIDVSMKAVLDDLYTAQIRYELWPRERGPDASKRWEAFCRGIGDRAGSVTLSGSNSTVEPAGGAATSQPGWNGTLGWKDGRPRLLVGPGETRFQFDLTRAP